MSGVSRQAAGCPAMSMLAADSHRSRDLRPAFEIQALPADFMDFIDPGQVSTSLLSIEGLKPEIIGVVESHTEQFKPWNA